MKSKIRRFFETASIKQEHELMAVNPGLHEQPWLRTRIKACLFTQTFASGKG
jgi:hypothetical protein